MPQAIRRMDSVDHRDLESFIAKSLEIGSRKRKSPLCSEPESLKELAIRYGLTKSQWDELCREGENHKTRGLHFFDAGNWDETISELEPALAIAPYDSEIRFALAKAHAERFHETGSQDDAVVAERLLRQCLGEDPGHVKAVQELTRLKKKPQPKTGILFFVVGLAIAGALTGFLLSQHGPEPSREDKQDEELPPVFAEEPVDADPIPKIPTETPVTGAVTLPVEFPVADLEDEFLFESRSSVFTRYGDKYGVELKGTIKPLAIELTEMTATAELVSADGAVVLTKNFDIHPSFRPSGLPGDSLPFQFLIFENSPPPDLRSVRIILRSFERTPFPDKVTPGKIIPLQTGANPLPPNFAIELRERTAQRSTGGILGEDKATLKLCFTIENTGERQISSLQLAVTLSDVEGEPLPMVHSPILSGLKKKAPGFISPVLSIYPAQLPGERRVVRTTFYVPDAAPEDIGEYTISLMEIE